MSTTAHEEPRAERDKLSIMLAVTLISATLFRFIELPTSYWGVRAVLGSPLNIAFSGDLVLILLMTGLVATGTHSLLQPLSSQHTAERPTGLALITPSLGTLLASLLLNRALTWPIWLSTMVLSGLSIGLLVHLSYQAFSPSVPGYATARTLLNIADYLIGFALFSLVLREQGRALITGPIIFILGLLITLELLSASGAPTGRVLLYSLITALLLTQIAWIIGYWPISSWTIAAILTLCLYVWSGLTYQHLLDRLDRRLVAEFVVTATLMFVLVLWIRP